MIQSCIFSTVKISAEFANNGREGIGKLKAKSRSCCRQPYKLIIVDNNMPVMGGIEMMNEIRELQKLGDLLEYKQSAFVLSSALSE